MWLGTPVRMLLVNGVRVRRGKDQPRHVLQDPTEHRKSGRTVLSTATGQRRDSGCRDRVRSSIECGFELMCLRVLGSCSYFVLSSGHCGRPTCEAGVRTRACWPRYGNCKWKHQPWSCGGYEPVGVNRRAPFK